MLISKLFSKRQVVEEIKKHITCGLSIFSKSKNKQYFLIKFCQIMKTISKKLINTKHEKNIVDSA